jgi:antirestriction protein ArdC
MPAMAAFNSANGYHSTLLHESVHATGHKSRLDRDFSKRFGDESYAFEELVAELGSAMLCAHCGIDGECKRTTLPILPIGLKFCATTKKPFSRPVRKPSKLLDFLTKAKQVDEALAA